MPKSLDLVLGVSAVMLLLSLAVTALTHYIVSLCNLRGRRLRDGLSTVLATLDPCIGSRHTAALAAAILQHPLICDAGGRMASWIHRAQLVRLCFALAADVEASGEAPEALRQALSAQGIDDPAETLKCIAQQALLLEEAHPALSELARQEMAITAVAAVPFVAEIHASFDQTMERVSARFTSSVRLITVAVALGLASFLQIDCLELVNQLSMDSATRSEVVKAALDGREIAAAAGNLRPALETQLLRDPASWSEWRWAHAMGILLTAMLLSLGAPFWYGLLSGAIRLRPAAGREVPDRQSEYAADSNRHNALMIE